MSDKGKPKRPNNVVIWGDDIGMTNLSCYSRGLMRYRKMNRNRLAVAVLCCVLVAIGAGTTRAEVSAQDGFAPDGSAQLHIEIAPYAWIPATGGSIKLGSGAAVNIGQGMPTVSQITSALKGAFIGFGQARYGPWSGEIDFQWVSAATSKDLSPGPLGVSRSLNLRTSLVRVAPGIGYEVYNGAIGSVPATLDARVGLAWFQMSETLNLDATGQLGRQRVSTLSDSSSFAQPWVGFRVAIYPWPRWRFEVGGLVQGFGVNGGSWGWGASADATWAATDWLNLIAGFRALNTERFPGSSRAVRSVNLTAYGPLIGLSFTF